MESKKWYAHPHSSFSHTPPSILANPVDSALEIYPDSASFPPVSTATILSHLHYCNSLVIGFPAFCPCSLFSTMTLCKQRSDGGTSPTLCWFPISIRGNVFTVNSLAFTELLPFFSQLPLLTLPSPSPSPSGVWPPRSSSNTPESFPLGPLPEAISSPDLLFHPFLLACPLSQYLNIQRYSLPSATPDLPFQLFLLCCPLA